MSVLILNRQGKPYTSEQLGVTVYKRGEVISCGCCRGPENDRCCCHHHQDISRGLRAGKCSLHSQT